MYYYIVDPSKLTQNQFERVQNQLYSCLSEYRISGETTRVTALRTIPQLVETAFSHGAKTIVAVGTDETLHDVINAVGEREVIIGFIPLAQTEMSRILGLKNIDMAAKTIAGRRVSSMDVGTVNGNFFMGRLSFGLNLEELASKSTFSFNFIKHLFNLPLVEIRFSADGQYTASLQGIGGVIVNGRDTEGQGVADPTDGVLDIMLLPKLNRLKIFKYRNEIVNGRFEKVPGSSVVHVRKLEILNPQGLALRVGNRVIAKTPAVIEIKPEALKIIVGKDRTF